MATIPVPGSELRHVRKTLVFDGTSGKGMLDTEGTLFTITGRVVVERIVGYFVSALTCAAPVDTVVGIGAGSVAATYSVIFNGDDPSVFAAGEWWAPNGVHEKQWAKITAISSASTYTNVGMALSTNIVLSVEDLGSGADITAGEIVFDVWYTPLTDDGALAGDDADEPARDHFWAKAMTELAAVPAITGSIFDAIRWVFTLNRNKVNQTSGQQTLRNDADDANIASASVGDDGTTFTRGEWS